MGSGGLAFRRPPQATHRSCSGLNATARTRALSIVSMNDTFAGTTLLPSSVEKARTLLRTLPDLPPKTNDTTCALASTAGAASPYSGRSTFVVFCSQREDFYFYSGFLLTINRSRSPHSLLTPAGGTHQRLLTPSRACLELGFSQKNVLLVQ